MAIIIYLIEQVQTSMFDAIFVSTRKQQRYLIDAVFVSTRKQQSNLIEEENRT